MCQEGVVAWHRGGYSMSMVLLSIEVDTSCVMRV